MNNQLGQLARLRLFVVPWGPVPLTVWWWLWSTNCQCRWPWKTPGHEQDQWHWHWKAKIIAEHTAEPIQKPCELKQTLSEFTVSTIISAYKYWWRWYGAFVFFCAVPPNPLRLNTGPRSMFLFLVVPKPTRQRKSAPHKKQPKNRKMLSLWSGGAPDNIR